MKGIEQAVREEAISVFLYGLDIFLPTKIDQILLLECLVNKKRRRMEVTNTTEGDAVGMFSLFKSISGLSSANSDALLLSVMERTSIPSNAWECIPPNLKRSSSNAHTSSSCVASSASSSSSCPPPQSCSSGMSPSSACVRPIEIGDIVIAGPDWTYGHQDRPNGVRTDHGKTAEESNVGHVVSCRLWLTDATPTPNPSPNKTERERERDKAMEGFFEGSEKRTSSSYKEFSRAKISQVEGVPSDSDVSQHGLCVTVQWTHGGVNSYRWGVPHCQADSSNRVNGIAADSVACGVKSLNVCIQSLPECCTERYYDVEIASSGEHHQPLQKAKKEVLKYTKGQVFESLVRGSGDIQAADVMEYLRSMGTTPPLSGEDSVGVAVEKSNGSEAPLEVRDVDECKEGESEAKEGGGKLDSVALKGAALQVDSMDPTEVYQQYRKYFTAHGIIIPERFSLFSTVKDDGDGLLPDLDMAHMTISKAFCRLMTSLSLLIESSHVDTSAREDTEGGGTHDRGGVTSGVREKALVESAQRLTSVLQGLMTGTGEYMTGKGAVKYTVTVAAVKNRVASQQFYGLDRSPLQWNWTDGLWDPSSRENGKKRKEICVFRGVNSSEGGQSEKVLTNLLFDSALMPDSLALNDSKCVVHQCWNRKWGTAVGNIALQPNTGLF